jgi:hypothetical protein
MLNIDKIISLEHKEKLINLVLNDDMLNAMKQLMALLSCSLIEAKNYFDKFKSN